MVSSLMTKLFGCVIEIKLHSWAQTNGKRAYMQCSFGDTIEPSVTLSLLESLLEDFLLKGNGFFFCIIYFEQALYMMLYKHIWICTE